MPVQPAATSFDADDPVPTATGFAPSDDSGGPRRRLRGRVPPPRLSAASFQAIRDRRLARREALEVRLTFRLRVGPGADERLTLLDDRRVPLLGSVFERRDDILRAFALLMAKGLMLQPKLLRGAVPVFRLLRHLPSPRAIRPGARGRGDPGRRRSPVP